MADPGSFSEPYELFAATQALSAGSFARAHKALDGLSDQHQHQPGAILIRLEIYEAQGSFLELEQFIAGILSKNLDISVELTGLLRLIRARCGMMTRLAIADYLPIALSAWDKWLELSNLDTCDRVIVSIQVDSLKLLDRYRRSNRTTP
jgi:hypothetical protein